ncbi:MAG: hypothetical protein HS117_01095 [Verrucomicrobiaceae bacterium]|nr:hypothetical protein [Verrucomicrobiaceae bacterium]
MAAGKGKQKLFIIPSKKLLIVQFADAEKNYREERFLSLALDMDAGAAIAYDGDELPPRAEQNFLVLDKNGDGSLSREEAGTQRFFDAADTDKNGVVTREEIATLVKRAGRL